MPSGDFEAGQRYHRHPFVIGLPLAYWLANTRWPGRFLIEALVTLPSRPANRPSWDFYLLVLMGPHSAGWQYPAQPDRSPAAIVVCGNSDWVRAVQPAVRRPTVHRCVQRSRPTADRGIGGAWAYRSWKHFVESQCRSVGPASLPELLLTFAPTMGEFGVVLIARWQHPRSHAQHWRFRFTTMSRRWTMRRRSKRLRCCSSSR